jgi:RNA polymerase sigma-70 factor (ECF subfamily)
MPAPRRSTHVTELPETIADDTAPAMQRLERSGHADELALTALYEAHRGELFAFLVRMIRDREAAEDLLQEAFIKLISETRAGRQPEQVRAWLYRVAANAAISRGRHGSVFNRLVPRLLDRREPSSPESEALRVERDSELHAALASLAPDAGAALLLAAQGFDGQEIAASIGRTEGATRTLLCRARVQLRLVLEAREGQA